MHTNNKDKRSKAILGLPQFKELSTSNAYMDHQMRLAISPIIGLETPAMLALIRKIKEYDQANMLQLQWFSLRPLD
jgi:hypothetical protein